MGARPGLGRSTERSGLAVASMEQRDLAGAVSARLERPVLLELRATLGSRGDGDRAIGQIVDQRGMRGRELRIHSIRGRGGADPRGNAGARGFGNLITQGTAARRQIALAGP